METIEKKVADTILQRSSDSLEIDGNVYPIAPPVHRNNHTHFGTDRRDAGGQD